MLTAAPHLRRRLPVDPALVVKFTATWPGHCATMLAQDVSTTVAIGFGVVAHDGDAVRIGRLVGPKTQLDAFLARYGQVINAAGNTIKVGFGPGSQLVCKNCVVVAIGERIESGDMAILHNIHILSATIDHVSNCP